MTPTGSTALALEIQALQKILADKEAEIEHLKERIAHLEDFVRYVKLRENGSNYDALRRRAEKLLSPEEL